MEDGGRQNNFLSTWPDFQLPKDSVRLAAVFRERSEENQHRANQQPRLAAQHQQHAPTDEKGEQRKHQHCQGKFHCADCNSSPAARKPGNCVPNCAGLKFTLLAGGLC